MVFDPQHQRMVGVHRDGLKERADVAAKPYPVIATGLAVCLEGMETGTHLELNRLPWMKHPDVLLVAIDVARNERAVEATIARDGDID